MRTGAWKFTSITCATSAAVRCGTGMRVGMPALFTRQSTRPDSRAAWCTSASAASRSPRSTGHARDSGACIAALGEHLLEPVGAPGDQPDGRAARREHRAERGADARRRAGDDDVGALDLHVVLLLGQP